MYPRHSGLWNKLQIIRRYVRELIQSRLDLDFHEGKSCIPRDAKTLRARTFARSTGKLDNKDSSHRERVALNRLFLPCHCNMQLVTARHFLSIKNAISSALNVPRVSARVSSIVEDERHRREN